MTTLVPMLVSKIHAIYTTLTQILLIVQGSSRTMLKSLLIYDLWSLVLLRAVPLRTVLKDRYEQSLTRIELQGHALHIILTSTKCTLLCVFMLSGITDT